MSNGKFLTYGNSKLKKSRKQHGVMIASFDLPAGVTCPRAGACRQFCYASTGNFGFKSVKGHAERNLAAVVDDRTQFIKDLQADIDQLKAKAKRAGCAPAIRIHASGDFFAEWYVDLWMTMAAVNPGVTFYCYTKSWMMFDAVLQRIPTNFIYMPSHGGQDDDKLTPQRQQVKVVPEGTAFKDSILVADSGYAEGADDDWTNVQNWRRGFSLALEAHGARKGRVK